MSLLLLLIQMCFGEWEFLSPQELTTKKAFVSIVNFGNPSYLNTYAKIIYTEAAGCILDGPFSRDEFVLIFYSSICNIFYLAENAQDLGASGIVFIIGSEIIGDNVIYAPSLSSSTSIGITVLLISKSLGELILQYSDQEVIIKYNYAKFSQISNPEINIIFTSNYTLDIPFIRSLKDLINTRDNYLTLSNIILTATNLDYKTYNATDCIYYDNINYICIPSSESVTGAEKLQNTALIFSYFYSLKDISEIDTFFNYLIDLYSSCFNNYTIDCNKDVLVKYAIPKESTSFLYKNNKYSSIIARCEISGIDVFWSDYIKDAYCFSRFVDGTMCGLYSGYCTYSMLMDGVCTPYCNNAAGHYDNLDCLKEEICYSFLLNNGQCEEACPDDPDCQKEQDRKDNLLLVKILVPIFSFILL
ncbi:hypothetical protein SteCoe_1894 [Stentor coeruleus]|uniref:LNR domain-containing protein n=1 Tax=Stentor coeruleus TaxID=5963 RepID=A0A1R2D0S7_9CILI|nr:hypothetical protein SteCoe_1894 [Stentor coeruleus]